MGQYSKVETEGRLLIVTINRPEVYNALHPMANKELSDVFDEFAANPELWVAIITGAGEAALRSRLPPTSSSPPSRPGSHCPSRASGSQREPGACSVSRATFPSSAP